METLCWSCKHCTNDIECSWASLEPRNDWTIKRDDMGGIIVIDCPKYIEDWRLLNTEDIARLLGISERSVCRYGDNKLIKLLNDKGYRVRIDRDGVKRYIYAYKVTEEEKAKPPSVKIADKI